MNFDDNDPLNPPIESETSAETPAALPEAHPTEPRQPETFCPPELPATLLETDAGNEGEIKRPRGKIARLPRTVRNRLNTLMDDGLTYPKIRAELGPDAAHLNDTDLCRWFKTGFQDWTKNQVWFENTCSRVDFANDVVAKNPDSEVHQANLHVAATQLIHDLIERGEPLLKQSPDKYLNLVNSIARISREGLNFQKYREACALARAEIAKLKNPKRQLTQDEILTVVDALDRILGFK